VLLSDFTKDKRETFQFLSLKGRETEGLYNETPTAGESKYIYFLSQNMSLKG
jgi:hypothetical protein